LFILDTDAITDDQNAHPILSAKVRNIPREQLFTTSVTVEEQLKGRLAYINRHRNNPRRSAQGHTALIQTVYYFSRWNILSYSEDADAIFRQLQRQRIRKRQRIRIGSQGLRIAAIGLLYGFTVVTFFLSVSYDGIFLSPLIKGVRGLSKRKVWLLETSVILLKCPTSMSKIGPLPLNNTP